MSSREIAPITLSDETGNLVQVQGKTDRIQLHMLTPIPGPVLYYRQLTGKSPIFYANLNEDPLQIHLIPDTLEKGFGSVSVEPAGVRYAYSEKNYTPREYSDFRIGEKETTRSVLSFENESWMHHGANFTWSPDGKWVAYTVQRRANNHGTYELQIYNTESTEIQTISPAEPVALRYISWDPTSTSESSRLIFTRISEKGVSLFLARIDKGESPEVKQLYRKESWWRGQQRIDADYAADGTILAKHLEYTRPSSSDSESELLNLGSEQAGYTTRTLFTSSEAGTRGFGYYTPAVEGPLVLVYNDSFWILDPATGEQKQVDSQLSGSRYLLPALYSIPETSFMVFEYANEKDREIYGLSISEARVYNLTKNPDADDYFYYAVTEK